jgi:hypothetical protein
VAAGYDEHDGRHGHLSAFEHQRFDVPGEVVHRNERHTTRPRERFGECHADEQRPDQTGSARDRDGVVAHRPSIEQCAFDDTTNVTDVLSSGEFRNHPAPFAVNPRLRSDDARPLTPWPCRVARLFDQGSGRLVAGSFNA